MVDACLDREDRIGKGGPRCKQFHGWRTEEGFRLTVTSRRLVSQLMQKQGGEREMRKGKSLRHQTFLRISADYSAIQVNFFFLKNTLN